MTIKMIARRNWAEDKSYDTWYRPFDERRYITTAITWLLNGHPEITAWPPPAMDRDSRAPARINAGPPAPADSW